MRLGQFLFTILLALVLLALIGFVDWSTVGSWGIFMLVLALIGPVFLIVSHLVIKLKDKKNDEAINKKLGTFFNWIIVISGFVIFVLIVSSQTDSNTSYQNQRLTNETKKVEEKGNSDRQQVVTNNYNNNDENNEDIKDTSSKDYAGQEYYETALEFEKQQEFQKSLSYLNKAIELSPDFAKAYEARGDVKYVLRNLSSALDDHQKAIEIDPNFKEAYVSRALVKMELGYNVQNICKDLAKAKELGSNAPLVHWERCE